MDLKPSETGQDAVVDSWLALRNEGQEEGQHLVDGRAETLRFGLLLGARRVSPRARLLERWGISSQSRRRCQSSLTLRNAQWDRQRASMKRVVTIHQARDLCAQRSPARHRWMLVV